MAAGGQGFVDFMNDTDQLLSIGEEQVEALEETLLGVQVVHSSRFVTEALKKLPELRECAKAAISRHQESYGLALPEMVQYQHLQQRATNLQYRSAEFYRRLVVVAVDFEPFLSFYCSEAEMDAGGMGDMESCHLQWAFHQLFHGGFVYNDVDELPPNWANAMAIYAPQNPDVHAYTPCECGCKDAAERFFANATGGGEYVHVAMTIPYQECIVSQNLDLFYHLY